MLAQKEHRDAKNTPQVPGRLRLFAVMLPAGIMVALGIAGCAFDSAGPGPRVVFDTLGCVNAVSRTTPHPPLNIYLNSSFTMCGFLYQPKAGLQTPFRLIYRELMKLQADGYYPHRFYRYAMNINQWPLSTNTDIRNSSVHRMLKPTDSTLAGVLSPRNFVFNRGLNRDLLDWMTRSRDTLSILVTDGIGEYRVPYNIEEICYQWFRKGGEIAVVLAYSPYTGAIYSQRRDARICIKGVVQRPFLVYIFGPPGSGVVDVAERLRRAAQFDPANDVWMYSLTDSSLHPTLTVDTTVVGHYASDRSRTCGYPWQWVRPGNADVRRPGPQPYYRLAVANEITYPAHLGADNWTNRVERWNGSGDEFLYKGAEGSWPQRGDVIELPAGWRKHASDEGAAYLLSLVPNPRVPPQPIPDVELISEENDDGDRRSWSKAYMFRSTMMEMVTAQLRAYGATRRSPSLGVLISE